MSVEDTLKERGAVYGKYSEGLSCKLAIQDAIITRFKQSNGHEMAMSDLMLFQDIIGKLSRLASDPSHKDSWHDLAGYALLIEEVINESK